MKPASVPNSRKLPRKPRLRSGAYSASDYGFVPANVFATIVRGLDELAAASQDLWKRGVEGETLSFRRREGGL